DVVAKTLARSRGSPDILHGTGHVVGNPGVDGYVVELADGKRRREPGFAAVVRDVDAAVVGGNHPLRIFWIDPEIVQIAVMQSLDVLQRLASINRVKHRNLREPHVLAIGRIDGERRVTPGALATGTCGVDEFPGCSPVIGSIEASLFGFDQRIDSPRVRRRDRDADLSPDAVGQTFALELFPGIAAVTRDVQAAPGPTTHEIPRQ